MDNLLRGAMPVHVAISSFESALQPNSAVYAYVYAYSLAVSKEDNWELRNLRLFLAPYPLSGFEEKLVQTKHVRAHRFIIEGGFDKVLSILRSLDDGLAIFPSVSLIWNPTDRLAIFDPNHQDTSLAQARLARLLIQDVYQRSDIDIFSKLDWELLSHDEPYNSIYDLQNDVNKMYLPTSSSVEVMAINPCVIDAGSTIVEDVATIVVRTPAHLDERNVSISVCVRKTDNTYDRFVLPTDEIQWEERGTIKFGTVTFKPDECFAVQGIARYLGNACHYWWLGNPTRLPNNRLIAYKQVDSGLEVLKQHLRFSEYGASKGDARIFEVAVSWLLWIYGFSPIHFGSDKRMQDFCDIIVSNSRGDIVLVECTTGMLKDGQKLTELHGRFTRLSAAMPDRVQVLPVIVTALTRNEVASELKAASELGIYVITQDELRTYVQNAFQSHDPNEIIDNALRSLKSDTQPVQAGDQWA